MEFRIKDARKMAKMTQKELAARLGISISTLSEYESGKYDPRSDVLCEIADICDVSVDFLLCHSEKEKMSVQLPEQALYVAKAYINLDDHGKRIVDSVLNEETRRMDNERAAKEKESKAVNEAVAPATKTIPLFGASFAAGKGEPDFGNMWEDYEVPIDTKADFAVHINGDSMEPYLPDGSIALGRRQTPRDGDVAALLLDGEFLVKQVCQDMYDNVYLFSLNRKRSDADVTIWHDSGRSLSCFGIIIMKENVPLPTE